MNEWLKKLISQIKELWAKWTVVQKVILIGIVVVVIGALILVVNLSSHTTEVPLFGNVAITDEAKRDNIIYRLSQENVEASVNAAGVITVKDEATARRMRMVLQTEDLVPSNVDPWNLFDVDRWTTTDFERNVNLQRSIKAQLEQHIEALEDIDKASVVLAMPEKDLFNQKPVTVSVVLFQKPGSDILSEKKAIQGIERLILKAIPGLTTENLVISDSKGVQVNDFEGLKDIERVDIIKKEQALISNLENQYRDKVLTALQHVFTQDRVRDLNIKIDMDMSQKTIEATEYSPIVRKVDNPDTPYDDSDTVDSITLSSETINKKWTGTGINPEGPTGIEGQNPPTYADMQNLYGTSEEVGEKKNQVINTKQISEIKSPSIDRFTVSVMIDGQYRFKFDDKGEYVPSKDGNKTREREYIEVTPEDIIKVESAIKDAIGFNKARGDSVSVKPIQFDRTKQHQEEDAAYFKEKEMATTIFYVLSGIVVVLIAFFIYKFISREIDRRKRLKQEELLRKNQMEREKVLWETEQSGMEVTMSVEERRRAELQENAISMAKDHPEDVALLIRTWLMEE